MASLRYGDDDMLIARNKLAENVLPRNWNIAEHYHYILQLLIDTDLTFSGFNDIKNIVITDAGELQRKASWLTVKLKSIHAKLKQVINI